MGRSEFLRLLLGGALSLQGCMAQGRKRLLGNHSPASPLKVDLEGALVAPSANLAHVLVRLSGPVTHTVLVMVATRDGADFFPDRRARAGVNYEPVSQWLVFRPGDDPYKVVEVALRGGAPSQWFEVVIPQDVQGAAAGVTSAQVRFQAGAHQPPPRPPRTRQPRPPSRGAQTFALDLASFRATDSGFADGKPCWRTRFSHGRTQQGNHEVGVYTDPEVYPGTRPFGVRDNQLVLRAEELASPLHAAGQVYQYGASVLTTQTLFHQTYGYFEWDARLNSSPGTWSGLWLLPASGAWPPEIDVVETPRNGRYGPGDTNIGAHWMEAGQHRSISARVPVNKTLGKPLDLVSDFHRHAVEWRPDLLTWYLDDEEIFQAPNHFHGPAYVLMDLTLGGWGGTVDLKRGSPEMVIRGFRVWR